jgi:hypothetical protein
LPVMRRSNLYVEYDTFQQEQRGSSLAAITAFSRSVRHFESVQEDVYAELRQSNVRQLLSLNYEAALTHQSQESWMQADMCRRTVAIITLRNQMHVGGFLFLRFLGMPAIKRDIVYREVFALEEIETILIELNEPLREAVVEDLRQKGNQQHRKGLARIMANHGSI